MLTVTKGATVAGTLVAAIVAATLVVVVAQVVIGVIVASDEKIVPDVPELFAWENPKGFVKGVIETEGAFMAADVVNTSCDAFEVVDVTAIEENIDFVDDVTSLFPNDTILGEKVK